MKCPICGEELDNDGPALSTGIPCAIIEIILLAIGSKGECCCDDCC